MTARLYVILGSHACRTGMLLLEHKGVAYETKTVPTGLHPVAVRLYGFPGNSTRTRRVGNKVPWLIGWAEGMGTVPALELDGERLMGNMRIARRLEELRPDPPLFPADPAARAAVEEAERWGDEVLQMEARRLVLAASLHGRDGLINGGDDGRLGPLLARNRTVRVAMARTFSPGFGANRRSERELVAALPGLLDRVDAWIADGVLNGPRLNAADLMIAPSLGLLSYRREGAEALAGRLAEGLMERVLPV